MVYLGEPVSQLDGSRYQHQNCVAASTSELANCSSLGYWKIAPSRIRTVTGDTSGGILYQDASAAISTITNGEVKLQWLYWAPQNSTTSTLDDLLIAPRVIAVSIALAVTRYTPYRTGTAGSGTHLIVVGAKRFVTVTRADGSTYKQKQAYVMDPGRTDAKWVWWPWSLLIKASAGSAGAGKVHVVYTRDLAGVKRVAKKGGYIRNAPNLTTSRAVSVLVKGQSYPVVNTVKGGNWTVDNRTGNGWSKLGEGRYVAGGRLR